MKPNMLKRKKEIMPTDLFYYENPDHLVNLVIMKAEFWKSGFILRKGNMNFQKSIII